MEKPGVTVVSLMPLLNVRDVSRSLEFYTSVLGFSVLSKWESDGRIAWARIGSGQVELMLNESESARKRSVFEPRQGSEFFSELVLYFEVHDVDALHARLKSLDLSVTPPFDTHYGVREMHARDQDGYQLAFTSSLTAA